MYLCYIRDICLYSYKFSRLVLYMYIMNTHVMMELIYGDPAKISLDKCIKVLKLTFQNVQEEIKDIH